MSWRTGGVGTALSHQPPVLRPRCDWDRFGHHDADGREPAHRPGVDDVHEESGGAGRDEESRVQAFLELPLEGRRLRNCRMFRVQHFLFFSPILK